MSDILTIFLTKMSDILTIFGFLRDNYSLDTWFDIASFLLINIKNVQSCHFFISKMCNFAEK